MKEFKKHYKPVTWPKLLVLAVVSMLSMPSAVWMRTTMVYRSVPPSVLTSPRRQSIFVQPLNRFTQDHPATPAGATIVVTDLTQKVGGIGGCSLPEAIYSANFDRNVAIDSTNPDHFVITNCTAGNGDDTIVLPAGALFQMSGIIADAYNSYGPTATPLVFSNIDIQTNGSTFQRTSTTENYRAFTVGTACYGRPTKTESPTIPSSLHRSLRSSLFRASVASAASRK